MRLTTMLHRGTFFVQPQHRILGAKIATPRCGQQSQRAMSTAQGKMWADVDDYFAKHDPSTFGDTILQKVLENNSKHGLPPHDVSLNQGKLLGVYMAMLNAKRVLEIGTLGAYSTIHMARAIPSDGKISTIEVDPARAKVARDNLSLAGLADKVDVHVGPALQVLERNAEIWTKQKFDFVFIDADKINNSNYVSWALKMTRKGALIMVDNVAREGAILDSNSQDPSVKGVQNLCKMLKDDIHDKVVWTVVQTVGIKGWDGYLLAYVK